MDVGGRTAIGVPQIPSPAANHKRTLVFMDNHKKERPKSTVPNVAETTTTVVLTGALLSQGGYSCQRLPSINEEQWVLQATNTRGNAYHPPYVPWPCIVQGHGYLRESLCTLLLPGAEAQKVLRDEGAGRCRRRWLHTQEGVEGVLCWALCPLVRSLGQPFGGDQNKFFCSCCHLDTHNGSSDVFVPWSCEGRPTGTQDTGLQDREAPTPRRWHFDSFCACPQTPILIGLAGLASGAGVGALHTVWSAHCSDTR